MKDSITKDTDITRLLDSTAFAQEMNDLTETIISKISDRKEILLTETDAGLNAEQLLDNQPFLYDKATETYDEYENTRLALDSFINKAVSAAAEEELAELEILKKCLGDYIEVKETNITNFETAYKNEMSGTENHWYSLASTRTKNTANAIAIEQKYYGTEGYITIEQAKRDDAKERLETVEARITKAEEVYSVYTSS